MRGNEIDVAAASRIARRGLARAVPAHRAMACRRCAADREFLVSKKRPNYEGTPSPLQLVDLFAGGGGLTIGVAEAAHRMGRGTEVALAVENDDRAADIYGLNLPRANLVRSSVEALFDGELTAPSSILSLLDVAFSVANVT